jgi:hypothetical protein
MRRVMLSHPLAVLGLVSRYLTNNLIALSPIPRKQAFARRTMRLRGVIRYYLSFRRAIPGLGVR